MERDIIVTCPYDKAHRIRRFKLMAHIVKCKKQHSGTTKIACPLNSSHVIDHNDLRDHLSSCSNLSYLVQHSEEKTDVAPIMDADIHKSDENWNEIPEVPSYDAMTNTASKKVIRCVNGLTKSERLKYRLNERDRIAKLNGGSPIVEQVRSLHKETIHEIAVRPPCDITQAENNTKASQQASKSAQEQNSDASSTETATTNEFRDTFKKTLYNELLPDCNPNDGWKDNTVVINENRHIKSEDCVRTSNILQKLLEHSMANSDTSYKSFNCPNSSPGPSARNQFEISEKEGRKEKSLSFADQSQEMKSRKKQKDISELHASCDIFSANTSNREIEHTEDTRDSNKRVTDKLLSLLIDKTGKMELVEESKENDEKDEKEMLSSFMETSLWKNVIYTLTDRLDDLTNAQSIAAEQSARLAKEVNDLKQKSCCNIQSSVALNNSRCAANFTEQMSPLIQTHSKNHNVSQQASTSLGSSYNANRDNNMFNLTDNSKLPELKTPEDFSLF